MRLTEDIAFSYEDPYVAGNSANSARRQLRCGARPSRLLGIQGIYDRAILTGDYDPFRYFAVETSDTPDVMCSVSA